MISEEERAELLRVAHCSIKSALRGEKYEPEVPVNGRLAENCGAFVTLTIGGRLRGCIGLIVSDQPLVRVVAEMAAAAAKDDYRFKPLRPDELAKIRLEISALSPLEPVNGPDEIEVGRHGLLIRKGHNSGLLLPQVAEREKWDALRFLEETCGKAGLPADAWRENAAIFRYEAEVWEED